MHPVGKASYGAGSLGGFRSGDRRQDRKKEISQRPMTFPQ
jgi:hypothetical protein